jgi:peptide/nickel transport system substrate-binding protein
MRRNRVQTVLATLWISTAFCTFLSIAQVEVSWTAEQPQYGGILTFAVGNEAPSKDGHQEGTYGLIHPCSPHYSLLLKFDEDNYPKIVGDLAESWTVSKDNKTYTFKIRRGVKFHDGSILTAKDIKATYDKIIFPPPGVVSNQKSTYSAVEKVETLDDHTVVFRLKWVAASFLGSLASPWNYIYKAEILAKDPHWYEKNVMGTGPFKFVEHVSGSHWVGKRNEDYFVKGRPYLDGYRATFIQSTGARVAAVRGGRVMAEFRGFSPSHIEELRKAMGDKIQIKESHVTSILTIAFNCQKKPFDDPRVRRALAFAVDHWEGSRILPKIANVKFVGGMLRPGSEFSLTEEELVKIPGFSKDIEASRREARRLLREAEVPEGFSLQILNRPPAMPFEPLAIWLIDQWRQIGLNVTQKVQELGPYYADARAGKYDLLMISISDYMDEPDLQFGRFLSSDKTSQNYGHYIDRVLDEVYLKQSQAMDPSERRKLCKQFQVRVLDEMAYMVPTLWWHRMIPISHKVRGIKLLPSHFLNQDLCNVWLSKD